MKKLTVKTNSIFDIFREAAAVFALLIFAIMIGPASLSLAANGNGAQGGSAAAESAGTILPLPSAPFAGFHKPEGGTGIEITKNLTARIVDNVRFIIGAVAVLVIIISSIRLITAEGDEEVFKKQQQVLTLAVLGLIIVGLSGELSQILTVEKGGFIRDPSKALKQIRIFDRSVQIILTFIKYIVGSIAVLGIVTNGVRLVTQGDNEEEITKVRKNLGWSIAGLLFILMASPLVNNVFYKIDVTRYPGVEPVRPGIDVKRGLGEIVGATNLIMKFVGPAAILALLAGGIMYIIAGGDEEKTNKAKKIIMWALIGIIVIYGSFGIISTFVAGRFESL